MITAYQTIGGMTPNFPMILEGNGSTLLENLFSQPGFGGPTWIMHPDFEWVKTQYTQPTLSNDMQTAVDDDCHDGDSVTNAIIITSPDGGEYYNLGEEVTIEWLINVSGDVDISLLKNGEFLENLGTTSATITGKYGAFDWTIPADFNASGNLTIVVASQSVSVADTSNSSFTVVSYETIDQNTISIEDYSPYMIFGGMEYNPELSIDGNVKTCWHNEIDETSLAGTLPSYVTYKFDKAYSLVGFSRIPRDKAFDINGYTLEVSSDGIRWTNAKTGNFPDELGLQVVEFNQVDNVRYVRFTATTSYKELHWASSAEFNLFYPNGETDIITNTQINNWGNPVRLTTTNSSIQISLQKRDMATVKILSVSGRVISSYLRSEYGVGTTILTFPNDLSNGIYLVQFMGDNASSMKSMTILK